VPDESAYVSHHRGVPNESAYVSHHRGVPDESAYVSHHRAVPDESAHMSHHRVAPEEAAHAHHTPTHDALSSLDVLGSAHYNPFINARPSMGRVELLRRLLLIIILGPPRVLLLLTCVLLAFVLALVGTAGHPPLARLPTWRRVLVWPIVPLIRGVVFSLGFVWVREEGSPATKVGGGAHLIVSNHVCFVEPLYLLSRTRGVTVSELKNASNPLLRAIFVALEPIFIDRAAASQADRAGARRAIEDAARDPTRRPVLIFPEGMCGNGRAVCSFKTGAFAPGLSLQPVVVDYRGNKAMDPAWVTIGPSALGLLFRMFSSLYVDLHVTWLPVQTPTAEELADASGHRFAERVRSLIAGTLGVPMTRHSYEDVQLAAVAARAHFPPAMAIVELDAVRSHVAVDGPTARALLSRFLAVCPDPGTGKITFEAFAQLLGEERARQKKEDAVVVGGGGGGDVAAAAAGAAALDPPRTPLARMPTFLSSALQAAAAGDEAPGTAELRRLFNALDRDGDGLVDFRTLLLGLGILTKGKEEGDGVGAVSPALASIAFAVLDDQGTGRVRQDRLAAMLRRAWPDLDDEAAAGIFTTADTDGDGALDEDEFKRWMASPQAAQHVPLFREKVLGFSGDWLGALAGRVKREAEEAARSRGGGWKEGQQQGTPKDKES
jgi:lysophosphatidylcholine acyltransferase / lyso-PAF acetyltransferase